MFRNSFVSEVQTKKHHVVELLITAYLKDVLINILNSEIFMLVL